MIAKLVGEGGETQEEGRKGSEKWQKEPGVTGEENDLKKKTIELGVKEEGPARQETG